MAGGKWAQKIQLGRETVPGTAVAATTIWRGVGGNLKDDSEVTMVDEQIGIAIPTNRSYIAQVGGSLSMAATPATYEQLLHILEAGIKTVGTGAADGPGSGKVYAYTTPTTTVNTIKTYTIETGDNQQAEEMAYCFVTKFTLSGERGQAVMMSADWIGRGVSGTTFTGSLTVPVVKEILSALGSLYIDNTTIGTTQVTETLLAWELSVETGWKAKWTIDGLATVFAFHYFDRDAFSAEFSATYEHNATAVAEKTKFRQNAVRLIRLQIAGDALTTPGTTYSYKTLRIDMAAKYTSFEALDADDGNSIIDCKAQVGYDPTAALGLSITVVNELASVP